MGVVRQRPVEKIVRPFQDFAEKQSSGGILLIAATEGIGWRHIYGVGWIAGIGFTMSLFISDLAFSDGILVASLISGVVGWTLLRRATSLNRPG